jgi:alpha-glucuronidase
MNRSIATGTKYIAQYREPVARMYESLKSCPDNLLLFMHHVPYTHVLHSGKTVIQHFYDEHYKGAEQATRFVEQWKALKGLVDEQRYGEVLALQEFQAGHAIVWRDAINTWFFNKSGIADAKGRVGRHPNRIEAESMRLVGYAATNITPSEAASGGRAVQIANPDQRGSASFTFAGKAGQYDIAVQYFDEDDGISEFRFAAAGRWVDQWRADNVLPTPSKLPDGHTSIRRTIRKLALRPGDEICVEGLASGGEQAVIDYVEVSRSKR